MTRQVIRTMKEMELVYYGTPGSIEIAKSDDPYGTGTTGIYSILYGAKVWSQLNQEANIFAALPKIPWDHSGFRVMTARPGAVGTGLDGGVAEDGTLPETTKGTFAEVYQKPKLVAHNFDVNEMMMELAGKDDTIGDPLAVGKEETGKHHIEMMNRMLLRDVDDVGTASSTDAQARVIESIDRVISGYAEKDIVSDESDVDIYNLDRHTAATNYDSYIDENDDVDRELTLTMIDSAFTAMQERGGTPKIIVTGYDTIARIQQLARSERRIVSERAVVPTYNGIKGLPGIDGGFVVSFWNGVPIIPSKDVTKDTLSRIYFIDTDYLKIKVLKPTQYFEAGIKTGNPFAINKFAQEGMYRTMAELICTFPRAQAKIRDLQ